MLAMLFLVVVVALLIGAVLAVVLHGLSDPLRFIEDEERRQSRAARAGRK